MLTFILTLLCIQVIGMVVFDFAFRDDKDTKLDRIMTSMLWIPMAFSVVIDMRKEKMNKM